MSCTPDLLISPAPHILPFATFSHTPEIKYTNNKERKHLTAVRAIVCHSVLCVFFLLKIFYDTSISPPCVQMHSIHPWCLWRPQEDIRVTDGCEPPHGWWETNSGCLLCKPVKYMCEGRKFAYIFKFHILLFHTPLSGRSAGYLRLKEDQ